MMIRKSAYAALLLVLGCQAAPTVTEQATTRSATVADMAPDTAAAIAELEAQIKADVYWLADEERGGRGLNTDGIEESAQFAALRFAQLGLEPAGEVGYFDTFTLNAGNTLIEDETELAFGDTQLTANEDYVPYGWSKMGAFEGNLAFGGYSISAERRGYDDYDDADVEGKVVLALRYEPHDEEGASLFLNDNEQRQMGRNFTRESELFRKARAAEAAGASALLIVNPPMHHEGKNPVDRFSSRGGRARVGIPVMQVSPETAGKLLAAAELPTLTELQTSIDSTGKPNTLVGEPVTVAGRWNAESETIIEKNVVAMMRGEGPLADEYIVVGGHYDHLGKGEYGSRSGTGPVHYGADDNASGTAAVMAIAELLAEQGNPEGRSVYFVLFSAEEIGLIGSREWVEDAPVEHDDIVAMLNYDMLGRPEDRTLRIGGVGTTQLFESMLDEAIPAAEIDWVDTGSSMDGRSDHAPFDRAGIPAMFFFGSLHDDYHTERDTPDKLDYDFLARASYASFEILEELRSTTDTLDYRDREQRMADSGQTPSGPQRDPGERRVRLGITPDMSAYSDSEEKGLLVAGVSDNTPAQRASLAQGDRILKLGEHDIADINDLQFALEDSEPGKTYPLHIKRGDELKQLSVTFDGTEVN
ncbi:MAG: M20/M25/M40 family metallo-hydrolase [Planctomycetota bacterium]